MQGFIDFIREKGIIGLAIAFIIGGAVQKVVTALVQDIINPLMAPILGFAKSLSEATATFGPVVLRWGDFLSVLIDFVILSAVIYFIFKGLKLDRIDKKTV